MKTFPVKALFGLAMAAAMFLAAGRSAGTPLSLSAILEERLYLPLILQAWPQPGPLLISEVMANPAGQEPDGEWIEIYNAGIVGIDLREYKLGDEETAGQAEGMLQFPPGAWIEPRGVIVVAHQAAAFKERFGAPPDFEMGESDPNVPDLLRYYAWATRGPNLTNTGDEVLLLDAEDHPVDGLSWGESREVFDPPVSKGAEGDSFERMPAGRDTDAAGDWILQPQPNPGRVTLDLPAPTATPVVTPVPRLLINELHADPDTQKGDANGDGVVETAGDEFVELVNLTGEALDLSGWVLEDQTGPRYTFTPGTVMADGCGLVVFGGGNPSGGFGGSEVQVASPGGLGLNNAGDTLALFDLASTLVLTYTYGSEGGDDQSLTRDPDLTGPEPLVKHGAVAAAAGALFSPGTRVDGQAFPGCNPSK